MAKKSNPKHFTCPEGMSYCTKCDSYDLLENFSNDKRGPNGKYFWCKRCARKQQNAHRDKSALRNKKNNYGISEREYLDLWNQQNGLCAICGNPETKVFRGTTGWLAVDHNHQTGEIRGLLCSACNAGLGCFRDDQHLLEKASAYLKERDTERTQNHRSDIPNDFSVQLEKAKELTREVKGLPKQIKGKDQDTDNLPLFSVN